MTGRTRDIKWREQQLRALLTLLRDNKTEISDALYRDLHKVSQ